ncbi:hypothetical protein DI53_3910 [Sphingobacterium deserti]|uniref:Uncharacterized protein n=1 Tax=Sphingobacterium deserti TaxID=1229276 RepID=A0A0B8T5S6_9SPHI|nr:hypothetical protein DI53_3910 [Sphingobacterium deserti]
MHYFPTSDMQLLLAYMKKKILRSGNRRIFKLTNYKLTYEVFLLLFVFKTLGLPQWYKLYLSLTSFNIVTVRDPFNSNEHLADMALAMLCSMEK